MANVPDTALAFPTELDLVDDLPRGPSRRLPRQVTFVLALLACVLLAVGAAGAAYTVGGAAREVPAVQADIGVLVADARAAGLAEGRKSGYDGGFAAGVTEGESTASKKSFARGYVHGTKRGYTDGLRDGRRRGYSDAVDDTATKYKKALDDIAKVLEQSKKDLLAAEKRADRLAKALVAVQKAAKAKPAPTP